MKTKMIKQKGFSLVELMIGLVIGLFVSLAIYNVFGVFEKQKRVTTGNSDAQTNGAIAIYNIQRDAEKAGFALPVYSNDFTPFSCPINTTIDHDNNAGTAAIGLSPVVITDGGAGSDTVAIRAGDSMRGGIATPMIAGTVPPIAQVDTTIGCAVGDTVLVMRDPPANGCNLTRASAITAAGATPRRVTLVANTNVASGNNFACLGVWNELRYSIVGNQLTRSGEIVAGTPSAVNVPIVADIVNMQAQYGVSATAASNRVEQWVDATGNWAPAAITVADRNRVKAIRVAIVARNGLLENTNVTAAAPTAWANVLIEVPAGSGNFVVSAAPAINLATTDANWRRYRYRVYESIIPIRNIIWSGGA
jgi:type IV pilus assembly protein PilW